MRELSEICSFISISERIGTAGQPTIEQLATVKAAGYEVVINLLPEEYEGIVEEREAVAALGLEYLQIPVYWNDPQLCDLEAFVAAMEKYADRRIFVHCAANMRASAFLYLYRVLHEQADAEDALADMHRIWIPNPVWDGFIAKALRAAG